MEVSDELAVLPMDRANDNCQFRLVYLDEDSRRPYWLSRYVPIYYCAFHPV